MYIWRIVESSYPFPSTKSSTTGKLFVMYILTSIYLSLKLICNFYLWFIFINDVNCLQLELIIELLGTPSLEDMQRACEGARAHLLRRQPRPRALHALYFLNSTQATNEAVHLLCQMLVFNPVYYIIIFEILM